MGKQHFLFQEPGVFGAATKLAAVTLEVTEDKAIRGYSGGVVKYSVIGLLNNRRFFLP